MPIINLQHTVKLNEEGAINTGDPSQMVFNTTVDLALELSKLYSKNIRQGANFRVKGVQAALRPVGSGYDVGLSSHVRFAYCPTTKHTKDAWKSLFGTWIGQKKLRAGALAKGTRYDDLEYAYDLGSVSTRTSTLLQGGLLDSTADKMVLYGSSSEDSGTERISLQDYWNSLQIQPAPSRYSASNDIVKPAKFDTQFPVEREFFTSADASSVATFETRVIPVPGFEDIQTDLTHLGGSNFDSPIETLPECANVFCGLLNIKGWVVPDDTVAQWPDEAVLEMVIWVESWKNIFATRKFKWNRPSQRSSKRSYTSRYNKKSYRRKGRK
jgi:hypothetical protein